MHNFSFCFKGSRTYVHGTDMFNNGLAFLQERYKAPLSNMDMSIHRIAAHNLVGSVVPTLNKLEIEPVAIFRFQAGTSQSQILYLAEGEHPINDRCDYDEESITINAQIDYKRQEITLINTTPYSPIEIVVAANKFLVQQLLPNAIGKWFFESTAKR